MAITDDSDDTYECLEGATSGLEAPVMSVRQHLRWFVIASLLLVWVMRAWKPHKPLLRFSRLDAALGDSEVSETPSPEAVEAMEILTAEVAKQLRKNPDLDDKGINRALEPFERVAAKNERDDYNLFGFSWVAAHTAHHGDRIAICVTYGAVSRLAILDRRTSRRLKVPAMLEWIYPWQSTPTFFADGGLAVISNSVQHGNRVAFRVDFLSPKTDGYKLVKSIQRCNSLDFGGMQSDVELDQMTVRFLLQEGKDYRVLSVHRVR